MDHFSGTFGEIKWAIWRQTRLGFCGDIDDEEDGANEDIAVVCKTLKPTADKLHFQQFLKDALAFHNVPAHPNLAQVSFLIHTTESSDVLGCWCGNLWKFRKS